MQDQELRNLQKVVAAMLDHINKLRNESQFMLSNVTYTIKESGTSKFLGTVKFTGSLYFAPED